MKLSSYLIILILKYDILKILCVSSSINQFKQQQQQLLLHHHQHHLQTLNSYFLNLIDLIKPKLLIYLRELKDNSLLLLIYTEPQLKEVEISEYQVNYVNKLNNKELIKIELNHDLSKRLIVELKDLYQNTPYKICIQAKLQFTCNNLLLFNGNNTLSPAMVSNNNEFVNNDDDLNKKFYYLLKQYCFNIASLVNLNSNHTNVNRTYVFNANKKIIINNCIDDIITRRSISIQALGSSLGAIIALLMIMSFIYLLQMCKPGKAIQKLNCCCTTANQTTSNEENV